MQLVTVTQTGRHWTPDKQPFCHCLGDRLPSLATYSRTVCTFALAACAHFQGLPNRPLPAKAKAIQHRIVLGQRALQQPFSRQDNKNLFAHGHSHRKGKGAARTAESPRLFAQPTSQLPHAPATQQSTCQAAQPARRSM